MEKTLLREVMDKLFKEKGERTEEAENCLRDMKKVSYPAL